MTDENDSLDEDFRKWFLSPLKPTSVEEYIQQVKYSRKQIRFYKLKYGPRRESIAYRNFRLMFKGGELR